MWIGGDSLAVGALCSVSPMQGGSFSVSIGMPQACQQRKSVALTITSSARPSRASGISSQSVFVAYFAKSKILDFNLADRDLASCTERLISISSVDLSDAQRNDASAPHE